MNKKTIIINWFRQDLRLEDNPSIDYLSKLNLPILNLFIFDDINCGDKKLGSASKYWLYYSLKNLNNLLDNKLSIFQGCALKVFKKLNTNYNIKSVTWNRCYEYTRNTINIRTNFSTRL